LADIFALNFYASQHESRGRWFTQYDWFRVHGFQLPTSIADPKKSDNRGKIGFSAGGEFEF
jgi:hypothetical protein